MSLRSSIPHSASRFLRPFLLLTVILFATEGHAQVLLPDSVKAVPAAPPGPLNPQRPFVTRSILKAAEMGAAIEFEVALKMRNFPELQARVGRGERVSRQEMATRYEPSAADYDAVSAWLAGQGLTITRRDSHHMAIFARGTVSQVRQALRVNFARVSMEGQEYTSAVSAPTVPAALSQVILGINGLQPHIRAHKHLIRRQDLPNALSGGGSYLPKQIAQAYDATALYNSSLKGSGEAIAIVIDTFPAASDLETFWEDAGISQSIANVSFIQAVTGQLPKPSGEETLDTEWSSAMAPGVHVRVYAATDLENGDLDQAYEQVYEDVTKHPDLGIHQMSMSYGEGETYTTLSQVDTDDQYFAELASAGVTIFASSGDDGATPGSQGTGDENGPVQVETPASDPNVTGVGGTTLVLSGSNSVTSEGVWNENGGASGGGVSEYFKRPSWQTGTGVVSGTNREVPDVCCAADPEYGAVIVLQGEEQTVGGTSWASPTWAAFSALINQARTGAGQSPLGILGPSIYPLLSAPNYPSSYLADFRDITGGNNATRRSNGKYEAGAGYDLCTGLGSPLAQPLAQLLASSSALVGVQMPAPVESVLAGENASFTVTVTGTSATYQWQRMPIGSSTWSNLGNGGPYSGVTGPALTIGAVTQAMSGDQFQCLVTIGSNTITTSPPSVMVVDMPLDISTVAGEAGVTGLADGASAQFSYPSGVAVDGSGDVYVADYGNNQIREITPGGVVSTPYGSLSGGSGNMNGSGNSALFNTPNAVMVDGSGNLYVADTGNRSIRKISGGVVSTLAATGFSIPEGVAVDGSGNVYVADAGTDTVREITPDGTVSTIAGQSGVAGYQDGDATTVALFNGPSSVAVDGSGNVYVADFGNSVVRKITGGTVSTIAGQSGQAGYLDGLGQKALFNAPVGVALDSAGDLFIADALVPTIGSTAAGNDVIRELSASGVVSTVAGQVGVTGTDDGTGAAAQFYSVQALAEGASGQVYLADTYNQTIRLGVSSAGTSTAPSAPVVASVSATAITGTSATLAGTVNPGGTATGVSFQYGLTTGYGTVTGTTTFGGSATVPFTAAIGPLNPGTVYHFQAVASNTNGTVYGADKAFTTLAAPAIGASPLVSLGGVGVEVSDTVNPEGVATTVSFEYGTSISYGSETAAQSIGSGDAAVTVISLFPELAPNTTYYYRLVTTSAAGTFYGPAESFTTPSFITELMEATGDLAPGLTGAEFAALGNPAGNDLNFIAFQATLVNGPGDVAATDDSGIWAVNTSGTLTLITRTGSPAPGTAALFASLSDPVYNDHEAVAFFGKLRLAAGEAGAANDTGIWSTSGGSLALVARRGGAAPGLAAGAEFESFSGLALPDQGGVLVLATAGANRKGIWEGNSTADLQLILREGDLFDGKRIGNFAFLPALSYVSGQTRSFAQGSGDIALRATFGDQSTGLLGVSGTNLQVLALSGSAAPGVAGGEFASFGNPSLNAIGDVAFAATLATGDGGITAPDRFGIWADDDTGALQLIAQTGQGAAGTVATFKTLDDPVYNDNEAVAFRALLNSGIGATAETAAGIWSNSGGALTLVAREGFQAPGCPTGATFAGFTSLALPNQGGVILLAALNLNAAAGVTSANQTGIWAVDTTGTLQLIVRTGDILDGRTISSLSFMPALSHVSGQTRNFNQTTGDLIYEATFTDKTSAIFQVVFP